MSIVHFQAIWLESKQKPEGITIDWDNLDIRIILIAPAFKQNVSRMSRKIGYPVDLVQIRRYSYEEEEFVLVEVLEEEIKKISITKAAEDWSWEYYEKEHGMEATNQFRKIVELIDEFNKKQNWDLPYNLNKYYTGFKNGNRVVFSVGWGGTYSWHVKFKVSEALAKSFKGNLWEFQRYDNSFNEALFRTSKPNVSSVEELITLFKAAYEGATRKKSAT